MKSFMLVCALLLVACGGGAQKDGKAIDLGSGSVSGSGVAADGSLLFDLGSQTWRLTPDDEVESLSTRGLEDVLVTSDGRTFGCFIRNRSVFTAEYQNGAFADQTEVFSLPDVDVDLCGECSRGIDECILLEDADRQPLVGVVRWDQYDAEGRERLLLGPIDGELEASEDVDGNIFVGWGGKPIAMINSNESPLCSYLIHCLTQLGEDDTETLLVDEAFLIGHAFSPGRAFAAVAHLEERYLGRNLPAVTIYDDSSGRGLGRSVDRLDMGIERLEMAVVGDAPVIAYMKSERGITVRVDGSNRSLSGDSLNGLHADGDDAFVVVFDGNKAQRFSMP